MEKALPEGNCAVVFWSYFFTDKLTCSSNYFSGAELCDLKCSQNRIFSALEVDVLKFQCWSGIVVPQLAPEKNGVQRIAETKVNRL